MFILSYITIAKDFKLTPFLKILSDGMSGVINLGCIRLFTSYVNTVKVTTIEIT